MLRSGFAGPLHAELSNFLNIFEELRTAADAENPGRRRFDESVRNLVNQSARTVLVLPSEVQLAFAEWRIENDPALQAVQGIVGDRLFLVDRKAVNEELDHREKDGDKVDQLVFFEPRADDFLSIFARPGSARQYLGSGQFGEN